LVMAHQSSADLLAGSTVFSVLIQVLN
jgi:hypothetical protein